MPHEPSRRRFLASLGEAGACPLPLVAGRDRLRAGGSGPRGR